MQKEPKKLIYKLARGTGNEALQELLTRALRKYSKPQKRVEELGADGAEVRFIAYGKKHQQALIGVFHKFTKGRAQEVIEMVRDGDEWPVHLVTTGKEAQEFVEGTLFFMVWKNHLVIHQTMSCRADFFQEHLSWLLSRGNADGRISTQTLVELVDPLPPNIRKKSKMPVKEITVGSSVDSAVVKPAKVAPTVRHASAIFSPKGRIWEAIKEIMTAVNAPVPDDLQLDESLGEDDLKVFLKLWCSKKKAESGAGQVLTALGRSLSHSDVPYSVMLQDGSEIKGDALKVKKTASVECVDHHPVHESMFRCMIEYMTALVEDETIIENEPFGNTK